MLEKKVIDKSEESIEDSDDDEDVQRNQIKTRRNKRRYNIYDYIDDKAEEEEEEPMHKQINENEEKLIQLYKQGRKTNYIYDDIENIDD